MIATAPQPVSLYQDMYAQFSAGLDPETYKRDVLPMLNMPAPHAIQQQIIDEAQRFNVISAGRRTGKSMLGINRAVDVLMTGQPVGWFSPSYRMLNDVWREMRNILQPIVSRVSAQERRIEVATGGVLDMWSLDRPDSARGRKYQRVIIDEAAMIRDLDNAWNAVIRPTLADYRGDAWFLSTPRGRDFFWRLWQRGASGDDPEWQAWQFPTAANPYIDNAEIEAARLSLPERIFEQEFLAAFLEDGAGGVFRRITEAATATALPCGEPGRQYVYGVDWGKSNDFTVITVLDATTRAQVAFDRFNQIDYQVQLGRLQALTERFKPAGLIVEHNSMGAPLIEQLQRAPYRLPVQPFTTTNATKAEIIDGLALALERGDIRILNEPTLIGELQAYESERLPSGLLRYGAPSGMHDDTVMSLALALYGIDHYRSRKVYTW